MEPARLRIALLVAGVACLAAACGDDIQYAAAPKKDSPAPSQRLPAGHPPMTGTSTTPSPGAPVPAGGGTEDPFADPADAGRSATAAPAIDRSKVYFSGRVVADPSFAPKPGCKIFINAGNPPEARPPVLSIPVVDPKFPLQFELTGANMAFGDTKVDGPLVLRILYSETGEIPPEPVHGLLFRTKPTEPIAPGTKDITLTLKQP